MVLEDKICDFCGSTHFHYFLKGITSWEYEGKFNLAQCQNCGLIFLVPRLSPQDLIKYYPPESYWGGKDIRKISLEMTDKWKKDRDRRYGFIYKEVLKQYPKPGKILDIGCGTGGFLTFFMEKGWQVLGTEISKEAALYSSKVYNFSVKEGDLLEINFSEEKFDVVVLNGVLEHIYSPLNTLEKINQLLSDNGLLIIVVPNIESLGFKIFKKDWWLLQLPRHLYQFSPKILKKYLEKSGFKILSINHFNWNHNFYSLYESFRFKFSPKFKKKDKGGLAKRENISSNPFVFLIKEIGKVFDLFFAASLTLLGAALKRGEQIVVYAKKT